jgi:hypothetical protein
MLTLECREDTGLGCPERPRRSLERASLASESARTLSRLTPSERVPTNGPAQTARVAKVMRRAWYPSGTPNLPASLMRP